MSHRRTAARNFHPAAPRPDGGSLAFLIGFGIVIDPRYGTVRGVAIHKTICPLAVSGWGWIVCGLAAGVCAFVRTTGRQLDQAAFREIRESLLPQINDLREEIGQLTRDVDKLQDDIEDRELTIRVAVGHIHELNQYISQPVGAPPILPDD